MEDPSGLAAFAGGGGAGMPCCDGAGAEVQPEPSACKCTSMHETRSIAAMAEPAALIRTDRTTRSCALHPSTASPWSEDLTWQVYISPSPGG